VGTPFLLLNYLRTHYGRHCEPFSRQNVLDCRILHIQSQKLSGGDTLWPLQKPSPGAWTQTPISAWLASVPIVPVIRNDHWSYLGPFTYVGVADIQSRRGLRSSCSDCLVQPPVHRFTVSSRAFSVAVHRVWNCMPL